METKNNNLTNAKQIVILSFLVIVSVAPVVFISIVGLPIAILGLALGTVGGIIMLDKMRNTTLPS